MNSHSLGINPFRFFDSVTCQGSGLVQVPDLDMPYESSVEIGASNEVLTYGQSLDRMMADDRLATIRRLSDDRWNWFRARLAQVADAAESEAARREEEWAVAEAVIPRERLHHERLRDANVSYWLGLQCRWAAAICRRLLLTIPTSTPDWAIEESEFGLAMPGVGEVRSAVGECPIAPRLELGEKRPTVPEVVRGSDLDVCGPAWFRLWIAGRRDDVVVINAVGARVSPIEERQARWLRQVGFAI